MLEKIKMEIEKQMEEDILYGDELHYLENLGYQVEYLNEKIVDIRRWETDTEYIAKITDKETEESVLIGVVNTMGNTEMQENQGITEIYKVKAEEVTKTIYKKIKEEE